LNKYLFAFLLYYWNLYRNYIFFSIIKYLLSLSEKLILTRNDHLIHKGQVGKVQRSPDILTSSS